jgi:hypothetical protein
MSNPILDIPIPHQADDWSCGAVCLHAAYQFLGVEVSLHTLREALPRTESGGTLAAFLGLDALRRGFKASIYTFNLQVFDPTWFYGEVDLRARLVAQSAARSDRTVQQATTGYLDFLALGGQVRHQELDRPLLTALLGKGPVIAGLSGTYLHRLPREVGTLQTDFDDLRGHPVGHFVVLRGYDGTAETVHISDPWHDSPRFPGGQYAVPSDHLIGAIMLGTMTYDANLLCLGPGAGAGAPGTDHP